MKLRLALAVSFLLAIPALAHAQLREVTVLFKDGFYVSGKVVENREVFSDPGGKMFAVPAAGGFMYLHDEVRKIHFTPSYVQEAFDKKLANDFIQLKRYSIPSPTYKMEVNWQIESVGEWNSKWLRGVKVLTQGGTRNIMLEQRLTNMNPHHVRVETASHEWSQFYLTKELGVETVRTLLYSYYKDKEEKKNSKDKAIPLKEEEYRLNIARFLFQAGWPDEAEEELEKTIKEFPAAKKTGEGLRADLKKKRGQAMAEEIEQAFKVGQQQEGQQKLAVFFKKEMDKLIDEKKLLALHDLKNKFEADTDRIRQVSQYLRELPPQLPAEGREFWAKAAGAILDELNYDSLPRLQTFQEYAKQYADQVQRKQKTGQSAAEVLALALSGWCVGDTSAAPDVAMAQTLWRAREAVLDMERNSLKRGLPPALTQEKDLTVDLLAQVIRHLPPPLHVNPGLNPANANANAKDPETVNFVMRDGSKGKYLVKLPPDYHPHRQYPVVILLQGAREKPATLLSRWEDHAAQHGYILAAPMWVSKFQDGYKYTGPEHLWALDCLRDLRQRYQVDSDRVFLFGWEQGGEMAYDVGLSHPDQFAGVLSMGGAPKFFSGRYGTNAQYTPFYVVEGDRNGAYPKLHRELFKEWNQNHYPCIYVEYKGRMSEWFDEEVPVMFDWMNKKKRASPAKELGRRHSSDVTKSEGFKMSRTTDGPFYWLIPEIMPKFVNRAKNWTNLPTAMVQATIATGNEQGGKGAPANIWYQINVQGIGLQGLSILIGPNMIDFDKPVKVRYNGQLGQGRRVTPSMQTLIEEYLRSHDRLRLYYAKIDMKL